MLTVKFTNKEDVYRFLEILRLNQFSERTYSATIRPCGDSEITVENASDYVNGYFQGIVHSFWSFDVKGSIWIE